MVFDLKSIGALVLRLIVVLGLLGCASVGSAQGTWSVISLPQKPGGRAGLACAERGAYRVPATSASGVPDGHPG